MARMHTHSSCLRTLCCVLALLAILLLLRNAFRAALPSNALPHPAFAASGAKPFPDPSPPASSLATLARGGPTLQLQAPPYPPPPPELYPVPRRTRPEPGSLSASSPIPRNIIQTARSHKGHPPRGAAFFHSWTRHNPSWDHYLYDDQEIEDFVWQHYNETVLKAFQDLPLGVMRADLFRYMVVYEIGGVYADMDTSCEAPVATWLRPHCHVALPIERDDWFCQWVFAATPRHPLLASVISTAIPRVTTGNFDIADNDFVHKTTGPAMFTDGVAAYLHALLGAPVDTTQLPVWVGLHREELERAGVCIYEREEMEAWVVNAFASQAIDLQSGSWVSWTVARERLQQQASMVGR